MFNQDKKKAPIVAVQQPLERNVIAKNTTINGNIKSIGDFRIDGTLEGDLQTKGKVIIGNSGIVKGNIKARNADIEGKMDGKLHLDKMLTIKSSAFIAGEVVVGKLSIEPGATFNATCEMKEAKKAEKKHDGKQADPKPEAKKTIK